MLVEDFLGSKPWKEIVFPLLQESIAGVSGRYTNGRYIHGDLTRTTTDRNYLTGYQRALMDLNNNLHDFVVAKQNILEKQKAEKASEQAPLYNPFLEEEPSDN